MSMYKFTLNPRVFVRNEKEVVVEENRWSLDGSDVGRVVYG